MNTITQKDVNVVKKKLKLTKNSRILNVSHYGCMDGSGASIPIYNSFDCVNYVRAKFSNVDEIARKIDPDKYDAVFFTDMSPNDPSILKDAKNVVIIDHHESALINHDPDNMRFVYIGESASILSKKFISKYFNTDISYLDILTKYINDYDMWIDPFGTSWHFNLLHYWYLKKDKFTHTKFIKRFANGNIGFNEEEKAYIQLREKELEAKWQETKKTFYHLDNLNGALIFGNDFVNELCHRLMDEYGFGIVVNKNPRSFQASVRCNAEGVPIGDILQELELGGGHDNAGGFNDETIGDFRKNLEKLCTHLYDNYEVLRA